MKIHAPFSGGYLLAAPTAALRNGAVQAVPSTVASTPVKKADGSHSRASAFSPSLFTTFGVKTANTPKRLSANAVTIAARIRMTSGR